MRENVRRKRPELWRNNSWFLHHDNAPAHTSHIVRDYLTKNNINTVPQAPYSPDMAPRFQNRPIKNVLKIGKRVGICVLLAMEITLKGIK
ncbi:Mariner Mos1 transposase [Anthophora retusa]